MRSDTSIRVCLLTSALGAVALGVLLFWTHSVNAQQVAGMEAQGFKVQLETYPPPHETQIKSLLEGEKAEPQGSHILLTKAKLKSFSTNGVLDMEARAPQCVFDTVQRTVSSTGLLQIQTANDRFLIEGHGFLMQTNGNLTLSNRVHTVILNFPGKPSKP